MALSPDETFRELVEENNMMREEIARLRAEAAWRLAADNAESDRWLRDPTNLAAVKAVGEKLYEKRIRAAFADDRAVDAVSSVLWGRCEDDLPSREDPSWRAAATRLLAVACKAVLGKEGSE